MGQMKKLNILFSIIYLQSDDKSVSIQQQKPIPEKKKWIHDPSSKYLL